MPCCNNHPWFHGLLHAVRQLSGGQDTSPPPLTGQLCVLLPPPPCPCVAAVVRHAGEQRLLSLNCKATIGAVSNPQNKNRVLGKAGHSRHLGIRPTVRGVAMNPIDHPHGGSTSGGRPSVSPWGLPTKSGYKTRQRHKPSSKFILVRRPRRFA